MTWMLATVTGPEEAEVAIAGGADIIDFANPEGPLGPPDLEVLESIVRAVGGRRRVSAGVGALPADGARAIEAVRRVAASGVDSILVPVSGRNDVVRALADPAREMRLIAVLLADRGAELALLEPLADVGFAGAFLDVADPGKGRLLDHMGPAGLSTFLSLCRGKGLVGGFAGELEAPDVPRLLALKPHVLGFRAALCRDHDRRAGLDPDAVAAIRRLIPAHETQDASRLPAADRCDRVFVRDFVLEMSIGAYRHERGRPQRVRFEVVADVPRPSGAGDDIGDVFSYDVILDTIRALAENRHVNLVETLAEEIASRLLEHGRVAAVTVKVEKLDVAPAVVGVEIVRRAP